MESLPGYLLSVVVTGYRFTIRARRSARLAVVHRDRDACAGAADLCLWRAPRGGFLWPGRGGNDLAAEADVPLARSGYVALG